MRNLLSQWLANTTKLRSWIILGGVCVLFGLAGMIVPMIKGLELSVAQESLKAAILISILSVWVLIGLFTYLNRYTKKRYFTLWTVAWLFYGIWLSLNYGLLKLPESPLLVMVKQWCVGVAATFLLWGCFRFLGLKVRQTLLGLFMGYLCVWSYVGAYHLENALYIQLPIFGLIGIASIMTAVCFFRYRHQKPYMGASLLGFGFLLWGTYFGNYPFFQATDDLAASGFFISAVLQLFIAVSMIILVLEEVRNTNQFAIQQLRSNRTEKAALKTRVISTEERYRSLFDQASEAIIITSASDFRILELNATAQRLLGISRNEASHHVLTAFCQGGHSACIPPKGGSEWFNWVCRQPHLKLIQKNGGSILTEVDGAPIAFDGHPAYQFFFREMTERTKLEQQLRQAEKLSALGQMISGVAHELNNPLAVIKGYMEIVLTHHDLPAQTRSDLQKVSQESTRAAKLVRNFLAFAREQPAHREMVNFNEIVERVLELRKFDLNKSFIDLEVDIAAQLPETNADPDQVQQIINNLITNSVQAMEQRPKPHRLKVSAREQGEVLQITIEDNGPGVPSELEQKIFEPFFTTKDVGTGTGLGLSIAHSIMTEHLGRIVYQSSPLGGASFTLEFPIVQMPFNSRVNSTPETVKSSGNRVNGAQILVLDDERLIAELLCEMLGILGHRPTLCLNPLKALELIETQQFDLILSDFRMPIMNGEEFQRGVLQKKPELAQRIIFLTGDVVTEDTHKFLETNGNPHIAKPFQMATLEQAISETLARLKRSESIKIS